MKLSAFLIILLLSSCAVRANDAPVSIKVVQAADGKIEIAVTNTSVSPLVIDQEALKEPGITVSKDLSQGEEVRELVTGAISGSVGGRWSLAQLQRREPKRVVSIAPGDTFTISMDVNTLLMRIDPKFPHGDIEVRCSFSSFLLAVDGKETTDAELKAWVNAEKVRVHWR